MHMGSSGETEVISVIGQGQLCKGLHGIAQKRHFLHGNTQKWPTKSRAWEQLSHSGTSSAMKRLRKQNEARIRYNKLSEKLKVGRMKKIKNIDEKCGEI